MEFDNLVVLSSKFVEKFPTKSAIQLAEVSCKRMEICYQRDKAERMQ